MSGNSEVRIVKVFSERSTTSSMTSSSDRPGQEQQAVNENQMKSEKHEYHSLDELPPQTRKYIDDLLGADASTKFDNISVVSEQMTRLGTRGAARRP